MRIFYRFPIDCAKLPPAIPMPQQQHIEILLALALLPTLAFAQREPGSVSGHVYCADTQQPARVAHVVLVPLPPAGTSIPPLRRDISQPNSTATRMDGSFTVGRVPPGDYYLSVTYSGYLSPEHSFSEEELHNSSAIPMENGASCRNQPATSGCLLVAGRTISAVSASASFLRVNTRCGYSATLNVRTH
jgi:hypothetical protein